MSNESHARICAECHAPMVLGKRDCQECGNPEWVWRHLAERGVIGVERT